MPNVPMRRVETLLCEPHKRRKTAAEWPGRYIGSVIGGDGQRIELGADYSEGEKTRGTGNKFCG